MALITVLLMTCMMTIELVISMRLIMALNTVSTMITMMNTTMYMKSKIHITPSFIFNQVTIITMTRTMNSIMTSATNMLKLIMVIIMVTIHLRKRVIIVMVYHTMILSPTVCLIMINSHTTTDILTSTSTWPTMVTWVMITTKILKISRIIESSDMDTQMTIQWTSSFMGNGRMIYPIQDSDTICMDLNTVMTDTLLTPLLRMVILQTHT